MILTKLTLSDFGLFAGRHEFALRPDESADEPRPIILFGGKNGTGKTTILEALRLCLYGQQALGMRTSAAEYQDYLDTRLHQSRTHTVSTALVALEFEHVHQGDLGLFRIERSWLRKDKEIVEQLTLLKDGDTHFGMGPDYWPQLLKELVPIGLADLFFFDGEQIQLLADDEKGGPGLGNALKELLGLTIIEQLEADLRVYLTRLGTSGNNDALEQRNALLKQKEMHSQEQETLQQDHASLTTRLGRLAHQIAEKENEIASRGGTFANQRSSLEAMKQSLAAQEKQAVQRLQEACAGLLPFALAPTIARAALSQIDQEERSEYAQATQEVLQEQTALLSARMGRDEFWQPIADSLAPEMRARIIEHVQATLLEQASTQAESGGGLLLHGLSAQDRQRVRTWVDQAAGPVRTQALVDVQTVADSRVKLEGIDAQLHAVPPNELLAPLLRDLSDLHTASNALVGECTAVETKLKRNKIDLDDVTRKIKRLDEELARSVKQEQKGGLAGRVIAMLPDFRTEQLRRKISDLEGAFADYFNRLARKTEFVSHVIINAQDFTMTLVSNDGRFIPKAQLSSGEKQIYAISLLWALRAVAGRPLPVVIDTPLGRLDSSHRQHLVERYFPNASHQVIILSTDTEIDATYFTDLEPFVSHAYHLVFDDATDSTHAAEGYFWKSPEPQMAVVYAS